jgi:hypothetical protein
VNRLRSTVTRARAARAHRRDERALQRALATAPTPESAHELAALRARR